MKKIGILIIFVMLLQGCSESKMTKKENEKTAIVDNASALTSTPKKASKEFPSISLTSSSFQSVIGWLSNDEILFIIFDKGKWTVQSYSVSNHLWKIIYTSTAPIMEGFIHPNKELILLHTSSNSSSAEVQIIHKNGYLVQSLSFESDELYMDWHPTNPNLIVFTTFYEDWTYNTFVYNSSTQNLQSIEVENPFVKWYDEDHLMLLRGSDSSLDGNELILYSIAEKSLKETGIMHLIDVQNLGKSMLYIQINEEKKLYEYRFMDNEKQSSFEWTSPAISNYSEWVIPTISNVNSNQFFLIKGLKSGNVDESSDRGILSSISLDGERELGEVLTQPIVCSPNGETCLGGYEKENWIQLNPLKEKVWIHLDE
ncbi:hypothetical protein [Psychrobacillus sp. L4]|uniref:YqgU-like beta propeller domain-containing protein n=1 Tax=Psychrobacillus sp. L4 TaxID=3236892 RepID=UPI0036F3EE22